jgi:hypothetical protein
MGRASREGYVDPQGGSSMSCLYEGHTYFQRNMGAR